MIVSTLLWVEAVLVVTNAKHNIPMKDFKMAAMHLMVTEATHLVVPAGGPQCGGVFTLHPRSTRYFRKSLWPVNSASITAVR